ncbi:hypothetical protein GS399_13110 [Pedobacter sp. HMF7647]|uniref:Uncharacterized protein n=1 Tax=Hufsiella arboris TaxID=2695275 RepID=A0A7K1YBD7_9SPHI|nr:hypothetical protein [Hufsiella arboris]MXV51917.1 hypothetical protein [Hufsiella arboris]
MRGLDGVLAAIGLIIIMLSAIGVHLNNNDPLADSFDAITQLVYLFILLGMYRIHSIYSE